MLDFKKMGRETLGGGKQIIHIKQRTLSRKIKQL